MTPEQFRRRLIMRGNLDMDSGYAIITTNSNSSAGTLRICGDSFNISQIASVILDGVSVTVSRTLSCGAGQHIVRINYRNLTTCRGMFEGIGKFYENVISIVSLDISHLDTSMAGMMDSMFNVANVNDIIGIDILDTYKVTDMSNMFEGVIYPASSLNLSGWGVSRVKSFQRFLSAAISTANTLEKVDMTGWDMSKATDMSYMFELQYALKEVIMTGPTNPNADVTDMFANITTSGTFYYNPAYDYSHIIAQLPSTWTAVSIS